MKGRDNCGRMHLTGDIERSARIARLVDRTDSSEQAACTSKNCYAPSVLFIIYVDTQACAALQPGLVYCALSGLDCLSLYPL